MKRSFLPPVRVLQEAAARPGGRLLGVNYFEAGAGQLEWNLRDLHFLRQRPQRAEPGSLSDALGRLLLLDFIDAVVQQPPTQAQDQEQDSALQCSSDHVDDRQRSHKTRWSDSSSVKLSWAGLHMRKSILCKDLKVHHNPYCFLERAYLFMREEADKVKCKVRKATEHILYL